MNRSLAKVDTYEYGTTKPDLRLISGVVSRQHTTSPGLWDSETPVKPLQTPSWDHFQASQPPSGWRCGCRRCPFGKFTGEKW